jgi:1-acyl-sn-glycerol-3-phosphate acyltransferase
VRTYYSAVRNFARFWFGLLTGWRITGTEHVPQSGGLIVAANHISFWDPPLIGAALPREMHYLAKEELFRGPLLGPLVRSLNAIPIRRGMADLSGLSKAIDALKAGGALIVFPEGSRMRDGRLHPARPGVGLIAVNTDVPIVPCYVSGSNQQRRWWGRRVRVQIRLGPARSWRDYADTVDLTPGRALYQSVGDGVMRAIAALKRDQEDEASPGAAAGRS